MPNPLEKKVLPNGMLHLAAFGQRLEPALGIRGILDLQGDGKSLRLVEVAGRRVGSHQHLVVDLDPGMHDLVLPLRRDRHLGGTVFVVSIASIRAPSTF